MDQATIDCLTAALSEALGVAALTSLIAYIRGYLIERGAAQVSEIVAESAFRHHLKRLIKGFVAKGATRLIPWLGVAFLIYDIIQAILHCF